MSEKSKRTKSGVVSGISNDLMMNRLMLWFVIAVGAVTVVMSLRNANNEITMFKTVAPIMTTVSLLLFLGSLVFFVIRWQKKIDDKDRTITKYNVLGTGIVALLCGITYSINAAMATGYSVALILGTTVLYFIWYIYAHDFFWLSAFCLTEGFLIHTGYGYMVVNGLSRFIQMGSRIGAIALPIVFVGAMMIWKNRKKSVMSVALCPTLLCAAVSCVGAVLLIMQSVLYVPTVYVLIALVAVYLAVGIIKTIRMI